MAAAPSSSSSSSPPLSQNRMSQLFSGVRAYFVESGIQARRLKIWSDKLKQFGGERLADHLSHEVTHIFALDAAKLRERITSPKLKKYHAKVLQYEWIQDCLKQGRVLPSQPYAIQIEPLHSNIHDVLEQSDADMKSGKPDDTTLSEERDGGSDNSCSTSTVVETGNVPLVAETGKPDLTISSEERGGGSDSSCSPSLVVETGVPSCEYIPPDVNRQITEPFAELRDIYKNALGDDRRSFSYHKAVSVLEKLPFKIEHIDQVKGLPSIGKSMQEHIEEILSTGKLLKLESFKNDEKVQTLILFSSIWGVGPATAQRLYEKGHRSLNDLRDEPSLTASQRLGLQFFNDLNVKITRHEVKEMEALVKRVSEEIEADMLVLCGGSYRRGKALCSDMDFVITHPDGSSHRGFLVKLIAALKQIDFLTEDLLVSATNSVEGTDSGVDTYYGLCKYPGRQLRHRIDFKVYSIEMYPFGLIAWTGNDVLNRRLRLLAEHKGYRLDDTGLYPLTRDSHGHKAKDGSISVPCKTEREVFDFLGFPWLEPHERNL